MTVTVPHHKTKQEVIGIIDQRITDLFAGAVGKQIEIVDPQKSWMDSTMTFSFKGKAGFIEVPLSGTVTVDDNSVTVTCDLPSMVKNFLGEQKILARVQEEVGRIVA